MFCNSNRIKILFANLILVFQSCSNFLIQEFRVLEYNHDEESIAVVFSTHVNESSIMRSFTLKEDGITVDGTFEIDDCFVKFFPLHGIRDNYNYEVQISENAESVDGRSLRDKFYWFFENRKETISPWIESGQYMDDINNGTGFFNYEIKFSESIEKNSFLDSVSIKPSIDYEVEFSEDGTFCRLYSKKAVDMEMDYVLTVSDNLMDLCRNKMNKEYLDVISMRKNEDEPTVSFIHDENILDCDSVNVNLPCECKIDVLFDHTMNLDVITSYVTIIPKSTDYKMELDYEYKNRISVTFNAEYGSECILSLEKGIKDIYGNSIKKNHDVKLKFNDENFRPVEFNMAYIQTGDGVFQKLSEDNTYSCIDFDPTFYPADGTNRDCRVIMIFKTSKNSTGIDLFSAMESIFFTTSNSCCTLVSRKVFLLKNSDLYSLGYVDDESDDGKLFGVEYVLTMTNQVRSGLVEINIGKELMDSLGNKMKNKIDLVYNK